jgi:hypothetical protein
VIPPGLLVNVHVPDVGNPFNTTLPVETLHVGCIMVPIVGAVGVAGWVSMTIFADAIEMHVDALVTV